MKVLLIGSGGREHALALKLNESESLTKLYCAPGNAGIAQCCTTVPIKQTDCEALVTFAKENEIDLTFVGPEDPLAMGIVDLFESESLAIIGPNKEGAQLEGSKKWAKMMMKKYNIPTATYETFTHAEDAKAYVKENTVPIVIKADGLAAGKGVTVALTHEEAYTAIEDCLIDNKFKDAGAEVVIESFLEGEEASIFAFTDGKTILPMTPAQDHKAIYDGDKGPNTGGMGAYSPAPLVTKDIEKEVLETVFKPLLNGLIAEGITYKGIIYAGLMIKDNRVNIVEFNARFGDPETQVVLPRLENDLLEIFKAIQNQTLDNITLTWKQNHAVCVILASEGYPESYEKHKEITGLNTQENCQIIHAGTTSENNKIYTNGGRVLGIVGTNSTLQTAIETAYKQVDTIAFSNKVFRSDIGKKGLRHLNSIENNA